MAKPKRRKDSSFQKEQTKSVFLYGKPNKEKLHCLQKMEASFVMLVNRNIHILNKNQDFLLQIVKNDKKDSDFRVFEKSIRPDGCNSAFFQVAFDYASHIYRTVSTISVWICMATTRQFLRNRKYCLPCQLWGRLKNRWYCKWKPCKTA